MSKFISPGNGKEVSDLPYFRFGSEMLETKSGYGWAISGQRSHFFRPLFEGGLPVVQGHCLEKHDGCRKKFEADKKPMVSLFGILERRYQFTKPF